MKTLLTHGYFLEEDPKEKQIMKPYPTLGLLYISAYLNERNVDHEVFDTTFRRETEFMDYVLEFKPELVAFYTNLMTKVKVLKLIQQIKSNPDLKDTKVVLGGPDITYNQENYLKHGADYLVVGEGEETMYELIQALSNDQPVDDINGLSYMDNAQLQKNEARVKMKNLDDLPLPNRAAYPIKKYLEVWKKHHGQSALNVSTQRGCPYTCKWCSTAVYGQSYRRRSPSSVVKELQQLKAEYAPDTFWFVDDVFTVSHKWLKQFRDEIIKAKLEIKFECITRAERMNDEVIQWLKESGCIRVWIGAESGSQKIIDAMDRRVDVNQVQQMLIRTRAAGIETGTFIMVGYPGETLDDIEKTAQYLSDALPNYFTVTKSYPIKGTALYNEIESDITEAPDWHTSTDREIDFKRKYSDFFYYLAIRYINSKVEYKRKQENGSPTAIKGIKMSLLKTGLLAASILK